MVGVVGSSPIEPTNENESLALPGAQCSKALYPNKEAPTGEYGYDTANVYRNHFGTTLVEDLFRSCSLV